MGIHLHKMMRVNKTTLTGVCSNCGPVPIKKKGNRYLCRVSQMRWTGLRYRNNQEYFIHKKSECERCGFVAEHKSQLDVDHIDKNRLNNSPENLRTLCANCHRLITYGSVIY